MDITVVSPTQVHLLDYHHPQCEQLYAAHWREEQKRKKYEQSLDVQHIIVVPLAVESFGGCGTASVPIFKTLARLVANRSDQPASSVSCWLYQRLAIALQKNNACAMIARQPLVFSVVIMFLVVPIVLRACIYTFICALLVTLVLYSHNNNNNNNFNFNNKG